MIESLLDRQKQRGLDRKLQTASGLIDLTSNDYFGFAKKKRVQSACPGATGSRLLTGHSSLYEELERWIAEFHRAESCLIFPSGYTANIGLLSALGTARTTFLYDLEIHASMIDGMRLGKGKNIPFRHNNLSSLERRLQHARPPVFVLIESVYSLSGDLAPIEAIAQLCAQYSADLLVDEAHATGIFGTRGEGLVCHLGLESKVFARIHTFSKALGAHGGCVVGSQSLKEYLLNYSRPLLYTTALPPSTLDHVAHNYKKCASQAQEQQASLQRLIQYFCHKTGRTNDQSPIHPLRIGNIEETRAAAHQLREKGIDLRAILPPTVRQKQPCLRLVLHSFNRPSEIDLLLEELI